MRPQDFFDACCVAMLNATPFPVPRSPHTDNYILSAFKDIYNHMDPRTWPGEVTSLAAELSLDTAKFQEAWEHFNRKGLVAHGA